MPRVSSSAGDRQAARGLGAGLLLVALAACAGPQPAAPLPGAAVPGRTETIALWQSATHVVLLPAADATAQDLAREYLHDAGEAWRIVEYQGTDRFSAGREVVIPLGDPHPLGLFPDGYQVVPVLCYHRFGTDLKNKLVISGPEFEKQMAYLQAQGYRVITLARLEEFLNGDKPLPPRAVVITIDDGYKSVYEVAFPILRSHGFPATLFIYTDYIGGGSGALTWDELKEMEASGLIDTQNHTKSHADLPALLPTGADKVRGELLVPVDLIGRKLGHPSPYLAYPYGKTAPEVIALAREARLRLGLTVDKGSNAFFDDPWRLRRTMIFAGEDFERFVKTVAWKEAYPK